jgi:ABC-type nitrate/sulfonate/bicarbonate transport system substrate-binding protein
VLNVAIISEGANTWPLYVALARGFFSREGLEVEVTLTGSSAKQLEDLCAGGYDIGFQQSDHIVRGVERGADLFIFMAHAHAPELSLVAVPGVRSLRDLGGKILAVDGARSGYALLLRRLLADSGFGEGDYTFKEFGGSRERFEALRDGAAVASFLNPPFDEALFQLGFGKLGSSRDYFPTYPGPVVATRRAWAKDNADRLVAFIRALRGAYDWLVDRRNKAEAVKILAERHKSDPAKAEAAYEAYVLQPPPEIRPEGLRQVIDVVWDAEGFRQPKAAPEKYLDLGYYAAARRADE